MTKTDKPLIQLSRKGLIVSIGLMFFVAAWMFILGVLVGRGTAPVALKIEQWKTELSERKAQMLKESEGNADEQVLDESGRKPELGFYEALKEVSSGKNHTVDMPPVAGSKKPTAAAAQAKPRNPPTAAPKPRTKPEPETAKAPAATEPADHGAIRFTVQVAALKEVQGARRMVDELRSKGYPAYQVKNVSADQSVWFRVRVGAFNQRAEAEKLLKQLKSHKINGLIVRSH